jgi:non-canonical (house-cleaning) NTP pyrophosphatase
MEMFHPPPSDCVVVALGSGSAIKIEATKTAFAALLAAGQLRLEPVIDAVSGVRPQPVGKSETVSGARNRALCAARRCSQARFAIGIENGMWEEEAGRPETLADAAFVVCLTVARKAGGDDFVVEEEVVELSDSLSIPPVRPFPVGQNGEWSMLKDPHGVLTNGLRPRKSFLISPLERISQHVARRLKREEKSAGENYPPHLES